MNILIVDDSNEKIRNVVSVIRSISDEFAIESASDYVSAVKKLVTHKYDLMISDLLLPIRTKETPDYCGGMNLVKEIERNNKIHSPNFIIGFTQYEEHKEQFSKIWRVIIYSPSDEVWKNQLISLIAHIRKAKLHSSDKSITRKPTIFFEGNTDARIFKSAIEIFCPDFESQVDLRSESSAGTSWVARQITIWASSLIKKDGKTYLKAAALVDGDSAGKNAIDEINRIIGSSSAGSNTFKVFKLSPSYAREIIPIVKKGINIPVTLEEMIPHKWWKYALEKNWLENRNDPDSFLADPKGWDKYHFSLKQHIDSLGLIEEEKIYLNKFNERFKEDFCNYIIGLESDERKNALVNFEPLINDIKRYLED